MKLVFDSESFARDLRTALNAKLTNRSCTLRGLSETLGIPQSTLWYLSGGFRKSKKPTKEIHLSLYANICSWLGCSLYKYIKHENEVRKNVVRSIDAGQ